MAEEFLDGPDVGAALEGVSCEAVAKRVTAYPFGDCRLSGGDLDRLLDGALVQMMPAPDTGAWVGREIAGRENVLPAPLPRGTAVFAFQPARQDSSTVITTGTRTGRLARTAWT